MDRKKLFFITMLIIIIVPAAFIGSPISYIPLTFIFLFISFSYLYIFIISRCFSIAVESTYVSRYERLSSADYFINIINSGFLVFPRVSFSVILESEDGHTVDNYEYNFILNPREKKDLKLTMEFPHIGRFKIRISKIKFYGFIDILFMNKNTRWKEELLITPKIYDIHDYEIDTVNPIFSVNYHVPHKLRGGEFNDVREYIPGDPIKNIHWKLSAHSNTFMTRVMSSDAVSGITIYLDLSSNGKFDYNKTADIYDCMVESAYAVALYALSKSYGVSFIYSCLNHSAYSFPKTYDELNELIYSLPKVSAGEKYSIELLIAEYSNTAMSLDNIIILTSRINIELINSIVDCKERGQFPLLCCIQSDSDTQVLSDDMKNRLLKSGIRYYIINTAKELSSALGGLK